LRVKGSQEKGMASEKSISIADSTWWSELFQFGIYKPTLGRVTRQVTAYALFALLAYGCLSLWYYFAPQSGSPEWYSTYGTYFHWGVPLTCLAASAWFCYRLVNYSRFAEFLISVEAEMNKVSWPSRAELIRSTIVVIFMLVFLAVVLFGFDVLWRTVFDLLYWATGVVKPVAPETLP
jgi:preprotein translocase subunit SecE